MPKDYARSANKRSNRHGEDGGRWRWPLALVLIALFAAGIFYLKQQTDKLAAAAAAQGESASNSIIKSTFKETAKDAPAPRKTDNGQAAAPVAAPQPKFDFYTTLPQGQTAATSKNTATTATPPPATDSAAPTAAATAPATPAPAAKPAATPADNNAALDKKALENTSQQDTADLIAMEIKKLGAKENTAAKAKTESAAKPASNYVIQLGAFKNHDDADQLKAQLLLQGLEVTLQPVKKGGTTLYRVIMGPYANLSTAKKQQHVLEADQIKSKIIKE